MMHSLGVVLGSILLGKNSILGSKQGKITFPKELSMLSALQGISLQCYDETTCKGKAESFIAHNMVGAQPGMEEPQPQGVCSPLRNRETGYQHGVPEL